MEAERLTGPKHELVWHRNQHGFIFKDAGYHAIDDPSATNGTAAIGVNDLGQIVGDYFAGEFGGSVHGFLLDAGGFDTIDVPFPGGSTRSFAASTTKAILWGCIRMDKEITAL
jgi:hypothetical protein